MPDENLRRYVRDSLAAGQSEAAIRSALASAGWTRENIDGVLGALKGNPPTTSSGGAIPPTVARPAQLKSNFWAGATIWANIAIVIFIYALIYLGISIIAANYQATLTFVNPLIIAGLTFFAVWLGVRSVLKKTLIDVQNVLSVSLYAILITIISEIVIIAVSFGLGRGSWWSAIAYLVQDAFVAVLVYYLLNKSSRVKQIVIVISLIFLGSSVIQGYAAYKQTAAVVQSIESLQQSENQISNGGAKIEEQTAYTNAAINFKMTIPAGWYVATDTSAAIDTVDLYSCPWLACDASLEISSEATSIGQLSDMVNSELSRVQNDLKAGSILSYKELDNLVPGATVIKEAYDTKYSLWPYSYDVIWPYQYPMADGTYETSTFGLFIWASNDKAAESLFPSLAVYGTPE